MERTDTTDFFAESINPYTLKFTSVQYEEEYTATKSISMAMPTYMTVSFLIASFLSILYRIVALYCAYNSIPFTTASINEEWIIFLVFIIPFTIEGVLRWTKKFQFMHGILAYTGVELSFVTAAFFTQKEAKFGISTAFGMLLIQGCVVVFISSWINAAVGNIILTVVTLGLYTSMFAEAEGLRGILLAYLFVIWGMNMGSAFLFIYEKAFRRMFYMEKEMKKSKEESQAILDYMPVGIAITACTGQGDTKCNRELMSYAPEISHVGNSLVSLPVETSTEGILSSIVSPNVLECIVDTSGSGQTLKDIVKNASSAIEANQTFRMICKETGKIFEVKAKILSKGFAEEKRIVVIKDQTVYEQLIKEKVIEKYQKMLLSSISHEIRNPLNSIEGHISMLSETAEAQALCLKVQYSVREIDFLLTGACELLITDSTTVVLQPFPFNVRLEIQKITDIIKSNVEAKGLALRTSISPNVPEKVSSDVKKYQLILYRLLANAAKHTYQGEIVVEVSYNVEGCVLTTSIVDTGIGISEEKRNNLFKLYSNINDANQYNPQGMGLGLSVCKRLSKILGGDIECISEENKGSKFTFTTLCYEMLSEMSSRDLEVPLESISGSAVHQIRLFFPKAVEEVKASRGLELQPEECKCAKVLVVDDEPTNRKVLMHYLKKMGLTAEEAENGKNAVQKVMTRHEGTCCKRYKLITMDINMPVMDGTEATQKLINFFKANPEAKAPIIAVTAANLEARSDVQSLLSVGFADLLQKPVSKDKFVDTVKKFVHD